MNIAVLFGGISPEREVSINGGKAVYKALKELGYNAIPIDPAYGTKCRETGERIVSDENFESEDYTKFDSKELINAINSEIFDEIDLAFLVLHGDNGEDGKIQSLLELRNIKYTGSNILASSLSMDKVTSKMVFSAAGILTPPWSPVRPKDYDNYDLFKEIRNELGSKLVIKPSNQGSTIGISLVLDGNLDDIHDAVLEASKYSADVIIESFIEGRELTVGIVGDDILPVIEIDPEDGFYDYEHKYTKGKTSYICPAEISDDIQEFTQEMAHLAFRVLGCSGFARADFRLDEDGQPFMLEMNTIPGFTETSLVPKAAQNIGWEFPDLCKKIIDLTLNVSGEENDE